MRIHPYDWSWVARDFVTLRIGPWDTLLSTGELLMGDFFINVYFDEQLDPSSLETLTELCLVVIPDDFGNSGFYFLYSLTAYY